MELVSAVAPQNGPGMLMPLADASGARAAIAAYEALKAAIVRPDDVQRIQGRDFLKKAFWRRVATCFGLSLELVREARGFDESGHLYYSVIYRAVAPNGRSMESDGYCSTAEKGREGWPEHNVRATAHTRAKNRAISDLVGGGEVSAEEMQDEDETPPRRASVQAVKTITLADCGKLATDYDISPDVFKAATKKYRGRWDDLYGAMMRYVTERDAPKPAPADDDERDTAYTFTDAGAAAEASAHDLAGAFGTRGA